MEALDQRSKSLQIQEPSSSLLNPVKREKEQADLEKLISECFEFLVPDEPLTVSRWAEQKRFMSSEETSRPGPWNNDLVPYLREIMDQLNEDEIEKVIFLKPTQVGGTECGINILGYIISEAPSRILYVLPDDDALKEFSEDRFQKVLTSNECFEHKYHEADSKDNMLRFGGGFCKFGSAGSPSDLASWSVPVVVMDEIDKYPKKSKNEASPLKLAEERTKNWPGKRKMFFWSTPTTKQGSIYKLHETADVKKKYHVPCPFCGEYQPLDWQQVKFDAEQPIGVIESTAYYECKHCQEKILDWQKPEMLKKGRWVAMNTPEGKIRSVGYSLNSLYSPWVSFGQMAREFMKSKDNALELMNFVNSWLGEPWEQKSAVMDADVILQHKTDCLMFVVPEWAQLLTGGVDVQKDHFYWEIHAWGPGTTGQVLAYGRVTTWDDIETIMGTTFDGERPGTKYRVCVYGVDTGFRTDEAYNYCWKHQGVAFPVKGSSTQMAAYLRVSNIQPKTPGLMPLQLWIVNTDMYKNEIATKLKTPIGRSSWMLNAECTKEFAEHIASEHKIVTDKGYERWEKKTSAKQNHWLDCCVYAFAVADLVNMRALQDIIVDAEIIDDYETGLEELPMAGFDI